MRKHSILIALALLSVTCGGGEYAGPHFASGPVSIRGWIAEIEPAGATYKIDDPAMRYSRRLNILRETTVAVEDVQYASGGVAETGAFIILDVPSGASTVLFNAPGIPNAPLLLEQIPANADVLIPGIELIGDKVGVSSPETIMVRVPASDKITEPRKTGDMAVVGGHRVPVWEVPLSNLVDRREYPEAPLPGSVPTVR